MLPSFRAHRMRASCPLEAASQLFFTFPALLDCSRIHREDHPRHITHQVLETKKALEQHSVCSAGCIFLSAWDFDGTILKGDSTEGLIESGSPVYAGLQETAINAGLSQIYKPGGFARFWKADFLMWTLNQKLPAGRPAVIMINGGEAPGEYRGKFTEVIQKFVQGSNPSG